MPALLVSTLVSAEEQAGRGTYPTTDQDLVGPVYSRETTERVKALNTTVKRLRDPTRLSESFRQAMENVSPRSGRASWDRPAEPSRIYTLPDISVAALAKGRDRAPSVMLRIDDKLQPVREGDIIILDKRNTDHQVRIERITADEVHVTVLPSRESLVLR